MPRPIQVLKVVAKIWNDGGDEKLEIVLRDNLPVPEPPQDIDENPQVLQCIQRLMGFIIGNLAEIEPGRPIVGPCFSGGARKLRRLSNDSLVISPTGGMSVDLYFIRSQARLRYYSERYKALKTNKERHSLRCDTTYKLLIANAVCGRGGFGRLRPINASADLVAYVAAWAPMPVLTL
jgi:hypothetical protein